MRRITSTLCALVLSVLPFQANALLMDMGSTYSANSPSAPLYYPEIERRKMWHSSHTIVEVEKGDTLYGIAQEFCGNSRLYPMIAELNGITNPDSIKVGDKIEIPCK